MLSKFSLLITCVSVISLSGPSQPTRKLSINGFTHWFTGRDSATVQLAPVAGPDALTTENGKTLAHVKFNVVKYGELSFPIKPSDALEALPVNLVKSKVVTIEYKANHEVILQLRQTGVHGGVHNHIVLPASAVFTKSVIYFSSFKGGRDPLDLSNVSKFNFAFLSNDPGDGYAELTVRSFKIDHYEP